jgi:hypothetical protein
MTRVTGRVIGCRGCAPGLDCPRHGAAPFKERVRREVTRVCSHEPCIVLGCIREDMHEGSHEFEEVGEAMHCAAMILRALRDAPEHARLDALAIACRVFCDGDLGSDPVSP